MRDTCHPAVAPADRRLFEAGWLGCGRVWAPHSLTWAGLKVGRHRAEQF